MNIYRVADLMPLLDKAAVIDAVRRALIVHAKGEVQSPMPGALIFPRVNGDCHIKFGSLADSKHFVVKVATGFYHNPARGLASNNGLVLTFDASNGMPVNLFLDEGWLTAWRTAAAAALGVQILAPRVDPVIGIIGIGLQAQLAAEWIPTLLPKASFAFYGRDPERAREVAERFGAVASVSAEALLDQCDIIVTATPSHRELFGSDSVRPGMHFVGIGADGPEKAELPVGMFARAAHILLDCPKQCTDLSDFGRACRAGAVSVSRATTLGDALAGSAPQRAANDISIVDLTGLAAQDIAIANLFAQLLDQQVHAAGSPRDHRFA